MLDPLTRAVLRSIAYLVLSLVMLIAVLTPSGAETMPKTPFGIPVQGGAPSAFAPKAASPLQARGPFGTLLSWVADTQQSMQRELAASVKRLKSGNAIGAAIALAGLSFLYGVVHAVGPGHGKTIISSYVVANEETVQARRHHLLHCRRTSGVNGGRAGRRAVDRAREQRAPGQCLVESARKRELCADCLGRPVSCW